MIEISKLREHGYLTIDFYLTKSCNKTCYYCTSWSREMKDLVVDMDFLTSLLEHFKDYKVRINLLGGEPALVKNLREVIVKIKEYDNALVAVLSNSLVRKFYPEVLEDPSVYYVEHLVLDFYPDKIEKLGRYDFLEENDLYNYNLIIQTPNYYEYRKNHDLKIDHKNTIFKTYNSRSPEYSVLDQAPEIDRKLCSLFPQVPVIDFPARKIRHCSKKTVKGSRMFDINKTNIDKMMNFDLFEFEEYCKTCTETINNPSMKQYLNLIWKE